MQTTRVALQPDHQGESDAAKWLGIGETPPRSNLVRHLNQNDLAHRWNISPRTLERWRWLKQGPAFLKIGGRVAYRMEDVLSYEATHLRASDPTANQFFRRVP